MPELVTEIVLVVERVATGNPKIGETSSFI
jgi:hypothetical protein